jgi:hypothetical protein
MKTLLLSLSLLGSLVAVPAFAADLGGPAPVPAPAPVVDIFQSRFPPVIVQFGPTTTYSTIICSNFTKLPDGTWKAIAPTQFSLGFVEGIVPPLRPIKSGGYIYNNIDLYSQLNAQCANGVVVARY